MTWITNPPGLLAVPPRRKRGAWHSPWTDGRQDELIARVNRHFTPPREDMKPIFRVPKGVWSGG